MVVGVVYISILYGLFFSNCSEVVRLDALKKSMKEYETSQYVNYGPIFQTEIST